MTNITTGTSSALELTVFAPELTNTNGQITTTSTQVAQHFAKSASVVNRAIRNLLAELPKEHACNFAPMLQDVEIGNSATRQDPAYRLTRDGFTLLAMGFTGKEALQWKLAYLDAFNKMEAELVKIESRPMPASLTITPAQAQHLRELVQLVVETGKQGHGETWSRLQRKMKVNSYLAIRPDQFEAAVEYLHGKFDDTSIAVIAAKHFPQLGQLPAPQQQQQLALTEPPCFKIDTPMLAGMIEGDMLDKQSLNMLANAVTKKQFCDAANNPDRGPGHDLAVKIKSMSPADLYAVNVAASMEVWTRAQFASKNQPPAAA